MSELLNIIGSLLTSASPDMMRNAMIAGAPPLKAARGMNKFDMDEMRYPRPMIMVQDRGYLSASRPAGIWKNGKP